MRAIMAFAALLIMQGWVLAAPPEKLYYLGYSGSSNTGWNSNESWQQAPRELLKPEEVLALPPLVAISFPGGGWLSRVLDPYLILLDIGSS